MKKIEFRNVALFLLLAFIPSWIIMTVLDYYWTTLTGAYVSHCTAMLMPGIACIIVRKWITQEGFGDVGFYFGDTRNYIYIIGFCLLLWGIPRVIDLSYGGSVLPLSERRLGPGFDFFMLFAGFIPAFGEELGWRGYLLQKLQPMGTRKALLIHGAIWGAWHWSLYFAPLLKGTIDLPVMLVGMFAMIVATALIGVFVGWLRLRFASIYLVTFWHHFYDYFRDTFAQWFTPSVHFSILNLFPLVIILFVSSYLLLSGEKSVRRLGDAAS